MGPVEFNWAYNHALGPGLSLKIPVCPVCGEAFNKRKRKDAIFAAGLAASIAIPALFSLLPEFTIVVFTSFVILVPTFLIAWQIAAWRLAPVRVRFLDRPRGVVRIRFRNPQFAAYWKDNLGLARSL